MPPPWDNRNCVSSVDLVPYWNYSIAQNFQRDGAPATYARGHPQTWDVDEADKLDFAQPVTSLSINATNELLAIASGGDIHIHQTKDRTEVQVLKGHGVTSVAWSPLQPTILASCADNPSARDSPEVKPQIVIWNLDEHAGRGDQLGEADIQRLARQAILNLDQDILDLEPKTGWALSSTERDTLASDLATSLTKLHGAHLIRGCTQLEGRFIEGRGESPFSSDGKSLVFMPQPRRQPRSNGNEPWNLSVLDMASRQVRCTLIGHTDNILWAGFSPHSALVGTACWDGTFRIWDSTTGIAVHVFEIPNRPQNWIAGFSPDGDLFAGTDGHGQIYVWRLVTGEMIGSYKFSESSSTWCRTLDWSPDSKYLAVSGQNLATVVIIEPRAAEEHQMVQRRQLSAEACEEGVRRHMDMLLETTRIKFLPDGRLAFKIAGDRGVEVYDPAKNEKMRFAPPHSEEPQSGCWGPFIYCPRESLLASVDDGPLKDNMWETKSSVVRFWKV